MNQTVKDPNALLKEMDSGKEHSVLEITTDNGGTWTYEKLPWSELGVICEPKLKEQMPTISPTL